MFKHKLYYNRKISIQPHFCIKTSREKSIKVEQVSWECCKESQWLHRTELEVTAVDGHTVSSVKIGAGRFKVHLRSKMYPGIPPTDKV